MNDDLKKIIKLIFEDAFYPVEIEHAGALGAQYLNGKWYMPRFGCDTLQHIFDGILEQCEYTGNFCPTAGGDKKQMRGEKHGS